MLARERARYQERFDAYEQAAIGTRVSYNFGGVGSEGTVVLVGAITHSQYGGAPERLLVIKTDKGAYQLLRADLGSIPSAYGEPDVPFVTIDVLAATGNAFAGTLDDFLNNTNRDEQFWRDMARGAAESEEQA